MDPHAAWTLANEARALQTRLARVKPFALVEPMLPAAALLPAAQSAIERYLVQGRRELAARLALYLRWLRGPRGCAAPAAEGQRRFTFLRLRFNAVLTQFDLFSDAISQRSEHESGVWLSGLDVVSADALRLRGQYYALPPIVCYLDRGAGAAIRRVRTRLPGGGENPVAIIRVPRERMVGSGIVSSLIHEVGHQAASLLGLVESLRPVLLGMQRGQRRRSARVWQYYERCISEIVADFFAVARVGITSTFGLIGVVSLPRAFVFRLDLEDPHPAPWLRVLLSCAIGDALYPHPQWQRTAKLWQSFYPLTGVAAPLRELLLDLVESLPAFVSLLVNHRPAALRGSTLAEALDTEQRTPARLAAQLRTWRVDPAQMYRAEPSLVFAAIGQGRADGRITPEAESNLLGKLLTHWALRSTLDQAFACSMLTAARA